VVSITDGADVVQAGMPLTYMIEVSNIGLADADNAIVQSTLSGALTDASWECVAGANAACPASGTGDIDVLVDLPAGSAVAFVLTAQLSPGFVGVVQSSIVAAAPDGILDSDTSNNLATDTSGTEAIFRSGFELPAANVKAWLQKFIARH
jgi:uncharacterized repeat protein (TIGR01451 family)